MKYSATMLVHNISIKKSIKPVLLSLIAIAFLFTGAGCSESSGSTSANQAAPPSQAVTQTTVATSTTATAPVSGSTATVTMTGAVTKNGKYEASCAAYYPAQNKGALFEAFESGSAGWRMAVGDTEHRVEGPQNSIDWGILNHFETGSYTMVQEGAQVVFGPGFKSATVKAKFQEVTKPDKIINVDASFTCE